MKVRLNRAFYRALEKSLKSWRENAVNQSEHIEKLLRRRTLFLLSSLPAIDVFGQEVAPGDLVLYAPSARKSIRLCIVANVDLKAQTIFLHDVELNKPYQVHSERFSRYQIQELYPIHRVGCVSEWRRGLSDQAIEEVACD